MKHKIIYAPIAKNGCSSLKYIFYTLLNSSETRSEPIDVHQYFLTDGAKYTLSTVPPEMAMKMLADIEYLKFAVIRNPLDRAVSAYVQKFVTSRIYNALPSIIVKDVVDWVYKNKGQIVDYEKSINFSQFVDYLTNTSDCDLESHWAPQYLYLEKVNFDKIFTLERMTDVYDFLGNRTGCSTPGVAINVTDIFETSCLSDISELYPSELLNYPSIPSYNNFLPTHIRDSLENKYGRDFCLYNKLKFRAF
ncbi:sulfotransferase family 2 domain-containing protein [Thiorhodospira sibirica]|uniref:sulfotransferase family 2 domain-containing protein n=1 Tax=Thiorhodospira sibirica TaxID=154347 RepID=UPI00131F048E|nr:sulfotransferase family 2 domain-containing protein [Thiorhodospira sibirica]